MTLDGGAPQGALQVVSPANLEAQLQQQAKDKVAGQQPDIPTGAAAQLVGYVRGQFEIMRNHRNTASGWNERMLIALRTFNGQYDASKLAEIRKFGGSEVYAKVVASKCRGASSLLRDVYLGPDRPWGLKPPADPDIPEEISQKIDALVRAEQQQLAGTPGEPPPEDFEDRRRQLLEAARDAVIKRAIDQAGLAEDKIEDILREGGFYHSFAELLVDIPVFPFAILAGPEVRIIPKIVWPPGGGPPSRQMVPILTWRRVAPFDFWMTPGVTAIENANCIEKCSATRAELNDCLDLPGYETAEIRAVLEQHGRGGIYDNWDTTDAERAVLESRENPAWNRSALLSMMKFSGNIQGQLLQDYGVAVPDELRDYNVEIWFIGSHVIKIQLNPSPRQRHKYFVTSYEKVPGTIVGNSLVDILGDVQESANGALRSLNNNLAISSGPQVVVNDERLAPDESGEDLYPWKRWHVRSDPAGNNTQAPIDFFMPTSNAATLQGVYQFWLSTADDISGIPKYVGGSGDSGGAGRTASGLAMLMGNASKLLQTVSANIDRDIWEPCLGELFDLIMLTDTSGMLTGEEKVTVLGVNVAIQRETQRQKALEFLAHTANPQDMHIIGIKGRGVVLRHVSTQLGMPGEEIVPNDQKLDQMQQAQEEQAAQQGQPAQMAVQKGILEGITLGAKQVVDEMIKQALPQAIAQGAMDANQQLPPGTPPGAPGADMARGAQAQGGQAPQLGQGGGPQVNTVGAPPAPGGPPAISPG